MPTLNKDILFLVFEELQEDAKSLFSCLMVNKIWCETAVPILWKNPWRYNINYITSSQSFETFATYLSDDTKEFLTEKGIQLPSIPLYFDYISFCRSFNVPVLNNMISVRSSEPRNQSILQEIYNLIIRKCPEMKYLNIESIKHQIFYSPEAKARLESLVELKCDTSIDSSYFEGLASICHNIQRLIIINKSLLLNNPLVKLIRKQRNLKYFEWKDDFGDDDYVEDPYREIFLALQKSADTLNFLVIAFDYIENYNYEQIPLQDELLTKLRKLKTLMITGDVLIPFSDDHLKKMVYPELEVFNMDFISLCETSSIIENSGGHLKELPLNYDYYDNCYDNIDDDESLIFIRRIYEKCPKIENLSLLLICSNQYFIEFERVLKDCQKLKTLTLRVLNIEEETSEELLSILIRSAPTNLREIRFLNNFEFSLKNLEDFLEGWRGRDAISIHTTNSTHKGDDYVNLINGYINEGVVKEFKYDP